jgi:hypothetical protein
MNRILMAIVLVTVTAIFAQGQKQTTAPAAASPDAVAEVRRIIEKGNAQWVEAWAKGDPRASRLPKMGSTGRQSKLVKGRQAIFERQKAAMAGADLGVKVTVTTVDVWLDGDVAYETGKYKYEYTEKGKPAIEEGRYVTMWKRQKDGGWKLAMDMGVPND